MPRLSNKQYQRQSMLAMAAYVAVMLGVWPLVRTVTGVPLKVLLALAPVLPMLYVIALMARRIRDSDELEQRMHLIALGVATGLVGALSMIGGFLASAQVWHLDGAILIWVFPALMFCYGITRWWVARRYGVSLACDGESRVPLHLRFLLMAIVTGVAAWWFRRSPDDRSLGMLCGMAAGFAVLGVVLGIVHWRRRQHHGEALP
ncbi:MAG TPA: hypothetical protein VIM06_04465 [Rhodanobacter sp.]